MLLLIWRIYLGQINEVEDIIMVIVKCLIEFEFSNRKKRLMHNDVAFIEEWCAENNLKINRLIYAEDKYIKSRSYSKR